MIWLLMGVVVMASGKNDWEITEVMFDPVNEATGEFVEISYLGELETDLSGAVIGDGSEADYVVDFEGEYDRGNVGLKVLPDGVVLVVDEDYDGYLDDFFEEMEVDLSTVWMVTVEDGRIGNGLGNKGDKIWWGDEVGELASVEWQTGENGYSQNWWGDVLMQKLSKKYTPGLMGPDLDQFLIDFDEVIDDVEKENDIQDEEITINHSEVEVMTISQVKELVDGSEVCLRGKVTVPVGVLDSNYLWVQDELGGIKIKWDDDLIEAGQVIEVRGKVNDLKYNRVIQAESVEVVGSEDLVFNVVSGDEISIMEMNLVEVVGEVEKKSGKSIYIVNGDEQTVRVYLSDGLGLTTEILKEDQLTVRGVVDETSAGYRLLPRYKEDIIWIEEEVVELPTVGPDWMRILGFGG